MKEHTKTITESTDDISQLVGQNLMIHKNSVFPFADIDEFLAELLQHNHKDSKLISIGAATPELLIACDKAGIEVSEILGKTAFTNSMDEILDSITSGDIIYLQNPHKLSGANFSLSDLKLIVENNKNGLNIIDEYYYDFFGISSMPLLTLCENLVIIRSFAAPFGIYSSDAGFALASPNMIRIFKEQFQLRKITNILRKTILATLSNNDILRERLKEIHEESLRITKALTALGIQCRITATDFLLLRVASVKDVGNYLRKLKIEVDNLDGYPKMQKYIRFRIESKFSNDRFIDAFEKMPQEFYKLKSVDLQQTTLRKPAEKNQLSLDELLNQKIAERSSNKINIEEKHLFKIMD